MWHESIESRHCAQQSFVGSMLPTMNPFYGFVFSLLFGIAAANITYTELTYGNTLINSYSNDTNSTATMYFEALLTSASTFISVSNIFLFFKYVSFHFVFLVKWYNLNNWTFPSSLTYICLTFSGWWCWRRLGKLNKPGILLLTIPTVKLIAI
jgi:hypothetical protein